MGRTHFSWRMHTPVGKTEARQSVWVRSPVQAPTSALAPRLGCWGDEKDGVFLTHLAREADFKSRAGREAVLLLMGYLAWLSFCRIPSSWGFLRQMCFAVSEVMPASGAPGHTHTWRGPSGQEAVRQKLVCACASRIPFAGCTFYPCVMEKSFLGRVAGAKMLMLGPGGKSFGHGNDIYALGRHMVGPDGKVLLRWSGSSG